MKDSNKKYAVILLASALGIAFCACGGGKAMAEGSEENGSTVTITNVSYDPTRELYAAYNKAFSDYYEAATGKKVKIIQSHGGSGSQARSVVEGADADVVTLALAHDITLIEEAGLISSGWMDEFEKDSSPYTSTIVFLVRKGNEKGIHDWDDLTREGVGVISPDPKSSGAACWNFLAAWYYAEQNLGEDEALIKEFLQKLYGNVVVMDSGARGAATTFVENGQGDVLVSWENEAIQVVSEYPGDYEIVYPSVSILAQPSVAVVDENADRRGTQDTAHDYLAWLYSEDAQRIIGEYGYRPSDENILKEYDDKYDLDMELCTIADFGGWDTAYEVYFKDGGVFDEIYGS